MKEYEIVREIFNACSGNQNADVSISEVKIEDGGIEAYIRKHYGDTAITIKKQALADTSMVYDVTGLGLVHKYTFTEI